MKLIDKLMIVILLILTSIILINYIAVKFLIYILLSSLGFYFLTFYFKYKTAFIILCFLFCLYIYLIINKQLNIFYIKKNKEEFSTASAINCDKFILAHGQSSPLGKTGVAPLPKTWTNKNTFKNYNFLKYTTYDKDNVRQAYWTWNNVYDNLVEQCKDYWNTQGVKLNNFSNKQLLGLNPSSQMVYDGVSSTSARPSWFK